MAITSIKIGKDLMQLKLRTRYVADVLKHAEAQAFSDLLMDSVDRPDKTVPPVLWGCMQNPEKEFSLLDAQNMMDDIHETDPDIDWSKLIKEVAVGSGFLKKDVAEAFMTITTSYQSKILERTKVMTEKFEKAMDEPAESTPKTT